MRIVREGRKVYLQQKKSWQCGDRRDTMLEVQALYHTDFHALSSNSHFLYHNKLPTLPVQEYLT